MPNKNALPNSWQGVFKEHARGVENPSLGKTSFGREECACDGRFERP